MYKLIKTKVKEKNDKLTFDIELIKSFASFDVAAAFFMGYVAAQKNKYILDEEDNKYISLRRKAIELPYRLSEELKDQSLEIILINTDKSVVEEKNCIRECLKKLNI